MAVVLFTGAIEAQTMRVVDRGAGQTPRLIVEVQAPADAMGGRGWIALSNISAPQFEALLLGAHVVT